MDVVRRVQWLAISMRTLRQSDVPQGSPVEYPPVEQGSGGDPEAGARRGLAVSNADRQPASQVRVRTPQRGLMGASRCAVTRLLIGTSQLGSHYAIVHN